MSDQSFNLSALTAILEQARAEEARCKKELLKVEAKVAAAKNRVETLADTIAQLSGGHHGKSQKEMILEIIREHDGEGLNAREILTKLEAVGFKITSQNPTASIHMAAEQLKKDGEIDIVTTPSGKVFKPFSF